MSRLAVIIPAMNEEKSISRVISDVRKAVDALIIVVSDASTDETVSVAKREGALVLSHVDNLGAWRATQTGIRYALKHGYERVVTLDGDGQHEAKYIADLLGESDNGIDLVIGSYVERGSVGRHVTWKTLNWLTRLGVRDLTSGFRCYSQKAMKVLASRQASMFEYQDVGVLLMLKSTDLSVSEVTVKMLDRKDGISRIFHSWLAVFSYLLYTLLLSVTKLFPGHSEKQFNYLTSNKNND